MSEIKQQKLSSEHSADDIWRAINTPLTGELGRLVNSYVVVEYENLGDEGTIQQGTLITYKPNLDELEPVLGITASMLPKDIALRVEEYDSYLRLRVDVLESDKHSGTIRHQVEDVDGVGLLIVGGELSLGGSRSMFEGPIASYAEQGLAAHGQRILGYLPVILSR